MLPQQKKGSSTKLKNNTCLDGDFTEDLAVDLVAKKKIVLFKQKKLIGNITGEKIVLG
jgi:hypothetical protein